MSSALNAETASKAVFRTNKEPLTTAYEFNRELYEKDFANEVIPRLKEKKGEAIVSAYGLHDMGHIYRAGEAFTDFYDGITDSPEDLGGTHAGILGAHDTVDDGIGKVLNYYDPPRRIIKKGITFDAVGSLSGTEEFELIRERDWRSEIKEMRENHRDLIYEPAVKELERVERENISASIIDGEGSEVLHNSIWNDIEPLWEHYGELLGVESPERFGCDRTLFMAIDSERDKGTIDLSGDYLGMKCTDSSIVHSTRWMPLYFGATTVRGSKSRKIFSRTVLRHITKAGEKITGEEWKDIQRTS